MANHLNTTKTNSTQQCGEGIMQNTEKAFSGAIELAKHSGASLDTIWNVTKFLCSIDSRPSDEAITISSVRGKLVAGVYKSLDFADS